VLHPLLDDFLDGVLLFWGEDLAPHLLDQGEEVLFNDIRLPFIEDAVLISPSVDEDRSTGTFLGQEENSVQQLKPMFPQLHLHFLIFCQSLIQVQLKDIVVEVEREDDDHMGVNFQVLIEQTVNIVLRILL